MRRIIITLIFVILLTSLASAEIILTQQPKNLYNLGETISIPVKIITIQNLNRFFTADIICNSKQTQIHKQFISLEPGEEEPINLIIPLIKTFTERSTGTCKIKLLLGEEYLLTNEFEISGILKIEIKSKKKEFAPGENIIIEGEATKENQEAVNGVIELKLINNETENIEVSETIRNSYFYINFSLPKDTKAGSYLVNLNANEKDFEGEITNSGTLNSNIIITQVPTSLEIILEEEVEPGTALQIKTVLHDQTGEKIESTSIITIKDSKSKILEQTEKPTDEFLEFPIEYNEPPAEWTIVAVSNKLTTETTFKIIEKQSIEIEVINKTLTLTNTGNVPYNQTVLVKIGGKPLNINTYLDVDETKKYILSAPDGEYKVEVITDKDQYSQSVMLTGKAISLREARTGIVKVIRHPIAWIFLIIILALVTFIFFKKGYKKSFFGYINRFKKKRKEIPLEKNSLIKTQNKAEISLSIKGDKQNVSIICLKIKNLKEISSKKTNAEETLQKTVNLVEEKNAAVYENQENIFFIFAPLKTKTFKNQRTAVEIAQKIRQILVEHNRLAKQKIKFGISLNYGTIIAKQEKDTMKFMSMGTLVTNAKKLAMISRQEILLTEEINNKLRSEVRTEKHNKGKKLNYFTIIELKQKQGHVKFIGDFLKRLERK